MERKCIRYKNSNLDENTNKKRERILAKVFEQWGQQNYNVYRRNKTEVKRAKNESWEKFEKKTNSIFSVNSKLFYRALK